MLIDFHHHYSPRLDKVWTAVGKQEPESGVLAYSLNERLYSVEIRLREMERAGVDMAVLSMPFPSILPLEHCKVINDSISNIVEQYPDRFTGMVHVPPLAGGAAVEELRRGINELGLKALCMNAHIADVPLSSASLYPIYREMERMDLPIFIHPSPLPPWWRYAKEYEMPRGIGREYELMVAIEHVIYGKVLENFPRLKLVFSHLGGGIVCMLGRIKYIDTHDLFPHPPSTLIPKPFDNYFSKLYFDTCGHGWVKGWVKMSPLLPTLAVVSHERLLFGTDYPQMNGTEENFRNFSKDHQRLEIDDSSKKILSENAKNILRI